MFNSVSSYVIMAQKVLSMHLDYHTTSIYRLFVTTILIWFIYAYKRPRSLSLSHSLSLIYIHTHTGYL